MMGIGFPELAIILVIIMIIFGAGKLPEIGNAFGKSIKNFKSSMKEAEGESDEQPAVETSSEAISPAPAASGKDSGLSSEDQKEQDIIDQAIRELDANRIDTIKTRHDGLVQERDVFTESLKKTPFGRGRDRGVSRDVM
jgi:TatA/E family protein of Tat protein translocase